MHQHTPSLPLGETSKLKFQLEQVLIQVKEHQRKILMLESEVKELNRQKELYENLQVLIYPLVNQWVARFRR